MSTLLFKLHNVPEDEAREVRDLLAEHRFDTYETHAGFWGIGVSAIWLVNREQLPEAKAVLKTYQAERAARESAKWSREEKPTVAGQLIRHPARFLLTLVAIAVVLGLSILPFLALFDSSGS